MPSDSQGIERRSDLSSNFLLLEIFEPWSHCFSLISLNERLLVLIIHFFFLILSADCHSTSLVRPPQVLSKLRLFIMHSFRIQWTERPGQPSARSFGKRKCRPGTWLRRCHPRPGSSLYMARMEELLNSYNTRYSLRKSLCPRLAGIPGIWRGRISRAPRDRGRSHPDWWLWWWSLKWLQRDRDRRFARG